MKKTFAFIALLIFTFVFVIILNSGNLNALDTKPRGPHHKFMEQLTEDQQEEVKAKMEELWESGASREEIRETIHKMLEEYGVDIPEKGKGSRGKRGSGHGRGFMKFGDQLTDDQKVAIKEKVESLREEGASREEIHTEVSAMLKEYGIEIPDDRREYRGKRGRRSEMGWMHFSEELNDEQRNAIREKVKTMHEDGASREEIHEQVESMLKEYGIEIPQEIQEHRKMMENLTEEQRKQVRSKMRKMRKEGASREEIHVEMKKMFEEFGLKNPESQSETDTGTSGKSLSIRAYPNPFNPETTIEYNLNASTQVSIKIFNIQGKQIRSLIDTYRQAGTYNLKWNGLNDNGTQVPSGVYFIRITAGNETLNHRIVMMK